MQGLVRFWLLSVSVLLRVGSFGMALTSTSSSSSSSSSSPSPTRGLSYDTIAKLARKRYQTNENDVPPMKGRVAVITGAAGGIGGELSRTVYRLGGTVVAMDRNSDGLEALQKSLIQDYSNASNSDDAKDRILIIPTNHEDLASVKEASELIISRFDRVDLLLNNAGFSYSNYAKSSAHGKDLAFTVNYLSHFLLTEKLLQSLSDGGRIVHVTSSFHWKVDGSELVPDPENGVPLAYQSDPNLQSPRHVPRSYPNTKLAQLWHSRSIAAEALSSGARCSSVCACPSWAATGIAGKGGRKFLEKYAFPVSDCGPGVTSAINGMFRSDDELGDALNNGTSFVANSRIIEYCFPRSLVASKFMAKILPGWRDFTSNVVGFLILFFQKYTHDDFIIQQTSPESFEDKEKRDRFYRWSKDEVKDWL